MTKLSTLQAKPLLLKAWHHLRKYHFTFKLTLICLAKMTSSAKMDISKICSCWTTLKDTDSKKIRLRFNIGLYTQVKALPSQILNLTSHSILQVAVAAWTKAAQLCSRNRWSCTLKVWSLEVLETVSMIGPLSSAKMQLLTNSCATKRILPNRRTLSRQKSLL